MLELLCFCFSKGASRYELLMCLSLQYHAAEGRPGSTSSGAGASVVPSESQRFAQYSKGSDATSVFSIGICIAVRLFLSLRSGALLAFSLDKGGGLVPHVPGQRDIIKALTSGGKGGCVRWGGKGTGSVLCRLKGLSVEAFFLIRRIFFYAFPFFISLSKGQTRKETVF